MNICVGTSEASQIIWKDVPISKIRRTSVSGGEADPFSIRDEAHMELWSGQGYQKIGVDIQVQRTTTGD